MGNQLFQEARKLVDMAKTANTPDAVAKAKNALNSAYANSTIAEHNQLQKMQDELV